MEQSRCDERRPEHLFHEYTRMQLLGLLAVPEPKRILVVGLGGASLTRALAAALPEARLDNVEIDPAVLEAARRFFYYREGPRMRTFLDDARAFAATTEERYDLVFLDAFDGIEIPAPLRTREFYAMVKGLLAPGGAVVSNFMRRSDLYERDRATLAATFPHTVAFAGLGNVVVVARLEPFEATAEEARALQRAFGDAYPLERYFEEAEEERSHTAPLLTDAELLP